MLFRLPDGNTAEAVRTALAVTFERLPQHLRRSLTWDRGKEMAQQAQFSVDTGVQIYFCDPQSPWQRGNQRECQQTATPILSLKAPTWLHSPSKTVTRLYIRSTVGLDKP